MDENVSATWPISDEIRLADIADRKKIIIFASRKGQSWQISPSAFQPATLEKFDKKYYKISEVAEMIGLPCSTLRFWESRFTIISPRRNRAGTRFYTPSDVEKLRMVAFLVKEKGLRLEAAQEELRNNHTGVSRRALALNRLHDVRDKLQELLDSLDSLR